MSTFFNLTHHGNVPVELPDDLSKEQVLSFRPFNEWLSTLAKSLALQSRPGHTFHADPYQLRSIKIQSYDMFRAPRVGFLKLVASLSNSAGETLPGIVFLRGGSVAILVILVPDDAPPNSTERYVLLTVQPRVPVGSLSFVELPAGMVDDHGSFAGAAAIEIKEELEMEIHESELVSLSELAAPKETTDDDEGLARAMFPSAGGCDECVRIFAHERLVPRSQLDSLTGKLTGLRDKGEKISLKLVRMQDVWKEGARDAKTLAALTLWEGLKREGKI